MTQKAISYRDYYASISLALLSSLFLAGTAGVGKYLTGIDSLQLVIFIRFFFPFLFIIIVVHYFRKKTTTAK